MSRFPSGAALAALLLIACGGGSSTGNDNGPAAVASVTVTLTASSVQVGSSVGASAVLRDASGNVLTGRTVTWSSGNTAVATVGSDGSVFTVSAGATTITATSGSRSGSAQLTVTQPPVASVVVNGTTRVKAGDSYSYTATAKLADGTVVQRPVTWSIAVPGTAIVTAGGAVTPLFAGTIGLVATIDGTQWVATLNAYDWTALSSSTVFGTALPADVSITNFLGQAEYPTLLIACGSSGTFAVGVGFNGIVTANGAVVYSGDQGVPISQTWLESSPNYNTLTYGGLSNGLQKSFATTLATNHFFTFTFGEFQHGAHTTQWRLTGMNAAIAPALAGCPSNALMAEGSATPEDVSNVLATLATASSATAAHRAARAAAGSSPSSAPMVQPAVRGTETIVMRRVGQ